MVKRFERLYLKEINSTQLYLKQIYANDPNLPPTLVWTTHQTAGYGRKGSPWIAPPDKSLLFSFVDRPQEPLFLWSARVALSLYETVRPWCTSPIYFKWPNDLYAPAGKLAGLLIEAQWHGAQLSAAFSGIGLNVYKAVLPPHLWATSIEASGHAPPSFEILLDDFEKHYFSWKDAPSPRVESVFTDCLWRHGPFRINGQLTDGTLLAWKSDGMLLLHTPQGQIQLDGHLVEMVWPPPAWPWT